MQFKVKFVLLITIFLWASAFVGIRVGLVGYSPGALALLRFLVASISMAIFYYIQDIKISIPWAVKLQLLIAGMAGIGIYNICLNIGEVTVSAGIASFVIGLMPVLTVLLSLIFMNEHFNRGVWSGILISLVGLIILALGERSQNEMIQGIILILVSALMGAILTIIQKKHLKNYHPIAITAWIMWGGTLLLLMFFPSLWEEVKTADSLSTLAAVYMGVFPGAIAYLFWGYVLRTVPASKAAISLYALPLASTLLGFLCLNERPSFYSLIGGGIALMGAMIAHRFQEQPQIRSSLDDKVVAV